MAPVVSSGLAERCLHLSFVSVFPDLGAQSKHFFRVSSIDVCATTTCRVDEGRMRLALK